MFLDNSIKHCTCWCQLNAPFIHYSCFLVEPWEVRAVVVDILEIETFKDSLVRNFFTVTDQ